ncbi:hypothetical protein [Mucilaginibacter myungsuensis]
MTHQQHTIIPVKFSHNGITIATKALKYAYRREVLYKIALPSSISSVQQCWISKNADEWKLVMGTDNEQKMMLELITAIKQQEQLSALQQTPADIKPALKSA